MFVVALVNVIDAARPFGGLKESDWAREHGNGAVNAYTEAQIICIAS